MKYCICGTPNPSDAKRCSYCGRDLTNVKADDKEYQEEKLTGTGKSEKQRKPAVKERNGSGNQGILAVIGGVIIVLLGIIIYLLVSGGNLFPSSGQENQEQNISGNQNAGSQNSATAGAAESSSQVSQAGQDQSYSSQELELPWVDPDASCVYADNLDPSQYYSWNYDKTFSFSYPSQLYQRVEGDNTLFEVQDGNNEIRYDFYSSEEGAHLCYQKINIAGGISEEEAALDWFDSELGNLYDTEVILKRPNTDGKSRYVFIGYVDSAQTVSVYEVLTAMDENLYRMRVEMPVPINSVDRSQKFYITECLYRECGFSGSSYGARSYQEYLEEEQ